LPLAREDLQRGGAPAILNSGPYISSGFSGGFGCSFSGADQVSLWCWRRSLWSATGLRASCPARFHSGAA